MSPSPHGPSKQNPPQHEPILGRRELLGYTGAFGAAFLAAQGLIRPAEGQEPAIQPARDETPPRRYEMKKSINLWAFPYPQKWSLRECFERAAKAGFDAVEINYALEGDLSPETSDEEIRGISRMARDLGVEISGVCSFLFWPYAFTHAEEARRKRGVELAHKMIDAARLLGTDNLLVVPGAVYVPWLADQPPVPNDICDARARAAVRELVPHAEQAGVSINIENIFANGYLYSPQEIVSFVDSFGSPRVQVHFDTGNIMQYQFPEHWVPILGKRIKNIHFKEWDKRTHEFNLATFRTLLDGTTNWPAVIESLDAVGYRGYLTFEYFHAFEHYPEALLYQTSDALDRMLGRKV